MSRFQVGETGIASIRFENLGGVTYLIDNLTYDYTAAVPEPTTLAIWSALGALGMIAARRRKRTA